MPPTAFITHPQHIVTYVGPLWRIYFQGGAHPTRWNDMRHFGPVKGMRFDPHPTPSTFHPSIGVTYVAAGLVTAFAETFQKTGTIDRSYRKAAIASWQPTRGLQLLDLSSNWPLLNGASASIQMGPKRYTQNWARAIYNVMGGTIDGVLYLSSVTSEPAMALFSRAKTANSFPPRPKENRLLSDAAADLYVFTAAKHTGFNVAR